MGEYTKLVKKLLEKQEVVTDSASDLYFGGKRFGHTRHRRIKRRGKDTRKDGFYNPK